MPATRILIVGGSTRAAADSVRRAGWQPVCADLFADLDLRRTAEVIPVRRYPVSLPEDVQHVRADGWFYCGALENYPDILQRMLTSNASYGPLLGTFPEALKLVRDPQWLAETLRSAGIVALDIASQSSPPIADGSWLQKPLASAGGRSIRVWNQAAEQDPLPEPHYFQRRAAGMGLSALFRFENGDIEWLGASRELEPTSESRPPSVFSYCGSCGPIDPSAIRRQLTAIAMTLLKRVVGLRGLVGLDFRLDRDTVMLTEVNPRYTASVEILELTSGQSFLNRTAFQSTDGKPLSAHQSPIVIAKQILYADRPLIAPDLSRYCNSTDDPWRIRPVADIPLPWTPIEPGWPICTVMAAGATVPAVETNLRERLAVIRSELAGNPIEGGCQ